MSEWKKLPDGKEKYHAYLRSEEWKAIRKSIWRRAGGTCERCGMRPMNHVHHLSYQSLYDEDLHDLEGYCELCHEYVHGRRRYDPSSMKDIEQEILEWCRE